MKYIPQIHGVKSPPKALVILNEDLNKANAPLIGALINCKRPANPRIALGLGGRGFTLTGALFAVTFDVLFKTLRSIMRAIDEIYTSNPWCQIPAKSPGNSKRRSKQSKCPAQKGINKLQTPC